MSHAKSGRVNNTNLKHENSETSRMQTIKTWAVDQIQKLTSELGLEREDIVQMVNNMVTQDPGSINETVSSFMDYGRDDVKTFISELIKRINNHRRYEEEAKKVQIRTDKQTKMAQ